MADIDSLQIKIKADANSASNALDKLATSLESFRKSVAWDTGKLYSIGTGIKNISDAATGFKGAKSKELTSLATALNNFNKVDTVSLRGVGSAMESLSRSMSGIQGIDVSGITSTAAAIAKLGGKNATQGTTNLLAMKDQLAEFVKGMNSVGTMTFDSTGLLNTAKAISKLGGTYSTQGVANLPALSAQLQNFVRQMNNIGALNFDTTNLANLVTSISKLGSVASGRAVGNIPLLAKNLKGLFTTLSTAPNVSENIIRMTEALANLARTGSSSGRAAQSLGKSLNTYSSSANRATRSTWSLAAAFGKFYASYFMVVRGIKSLWNAIEGTTDYIEAFNYYTVAFNKVGTEWGKDFEKFGYDNAESYAKSFGERVNTLLGKMSGLNVDVEGGLLTESGTKNLGLNLQQITQYASQLASVTNSLGQTGEVTTAISKSMTMLAGDISSLFNVDYESVATNLQSGLIGQSRALYKYGIDITNATLQTYAYKYGVEKAVSEMTQAEKQQLRLLAILDQSKVSWGDLANTINSPSNMIRQFTNNVKEAGMVLGQLFIPVLQKVLPVINGVVIAIKRLLVSIANLLGIKIDFESFGQGVSGYNDDLDDMSDSLDKVASSAKKANAGIRAFDELKVITTSKSNGSGTGAGSGGIDLTDEITAATAEYEKVWQEAFDKMQNTAQTWADKISKVLEPVKKLFSDLFKGDFFAAGQDVSGIVTGIFDWMSRAIEKVDWKGIGTKIGQFLDGIEWINIFTSIGNFFEKAITAAIDLWKGSFDAAPIETTILTAIGLLKFTGVGDTIWGKISDKLSATVLSKSIGIVPTIAIAAVTWLIGFDVGKSLGKALFPDDAEYYDNFTWFDEGGFFDTIKNTDFSTLADAWKQMNADVAKGLFTDQGNGKRRDGGFEDTESSLTSIVRKFKNSVEDLQDNFFYRLLNGTLFLPTHSAIDDFVDKVKEVPNAFDSIKNVVSDWFTNNVEPWTTKEKWSELGENIKTSLSGKWTEFTSWWSGTGIPEWWNNNVSPWFTKEKWQNFGETIKSSLKTKWNSFTSWWRSTGFANWWNNVKSYFTTGKWQGFGENIRSSLTNKWNSFTSWWRSTGFANWWNNVTSYFTTEKWNFQGIKDGLSQAWNNAIQAMKNIWNGFANWMNDALNFSWDPVVILGKQVVPGGSVNLGKIPTFETGGYVPSRYTMFMAGENGIPEIAGTVGGKTAVAGGAEITGIRDAVYSTSQTEIELLRAQNELLVQILNKEYGRSDKEIYNAVVKQNQKNYAKTHRQSLTF